MGNAHLTTLKSLHRELLSSVENDEWRSVDNVNKAIESYQDYANHQINQRVIEVILSEEDSQKIKILAQKFEQSIPTFTRNILHKYLGAALINIKPRKI